MLKIITAFSISIIVLIAIGIYAFQTTNDFKFSTESVRFSQNKITEAEKILGLVQRVESQQRLYIISGNKLFLKTYDLNRKELNQNLAFLNAKEQLQSQIIKDIQEKLDFVEKTIATYSSKGFEAAQTLVMTGEGERMMNRIRKDVDNFIQNENNFMSTQIELSRNHFSKTIRVILFSIFFTILIIVASLVFFIIDFKKRQAIQLELKESNQRFFKIFNKNPGAMILTNLSNYHIEFINDKFTHIFGFEEHEVIGKKSTELRIVTEDLQIQNYQEFLDTGSLNNIEINSKRKDGTNFWVSLSMELIELNEQKYILSTVFDIQDRKLMENKIKSLLDFQNVILDATNFSIITTSYPDGKITSFNAGAEAMLGFKAKEVLHKKSLVDFHLASELEERASRLSEELKIEVKPGGDVCYIKSRILNIKDTNEWTYVSKDGTLISVEASITTLRNTENNIVGYLCIAKDISDNKRAKDEIIRAKESAEQANILKETFLANMSHEIRTPMNAIIGFTDLLIKPELNPKEKDYIKTIKTSSENLLRIINDVLDISKIESGMMVFEQHPLSIKEVFSSLNNMLRKKAEDKQLKLEFKFDQNIPNIVLGDPTRLTQIIINCVGNAIKFTSKGSVFVFAKVLKEEHEHFDIEFSIKDTGIGIAADKLDLIFERFTQAETNTTRNYGGTGLGLSIVKQLVELQGGTISVESIEGEGTTFTFVLPFQKADENQQLISHSHHEIDLTELAKLKVLLVEDNPINIKFINSLFSENSLPKAEIAENGKIAIEKLKNSSYDIILMDIEMPEMNGYDTTVYIREELKLDIPIIAMTAHAMAGEKEKCVQLGMNDYLSKPINAKLLFEKMLYETSKKIEPPIPQKVEEQYINLDFLIESFNGNKALILEIIDSFLEQFPEDFTILENAVLEQNYLIIQKSSHKMKSTISVIGLTSLDDTLSQMEKLASESKNITSITNHFEKVKEVCHLALIQLEKERSKML